MENLRRFFTRVKNAGFGGSGSLGSASADSSVGLFTPSGVRVLQIGSTYSYEGRIYLENWHMDPNRLTLDLQEIGPELVEIAKQHGRHYEDCPPPWLNLRS